MQKVETKEEIQEITKDLGKKVDEMRIFKPINIFYQNIDWGINFSDFLKSYDVHVHQNMMIFNGKVHILNAQIIENNYHHNVLKLNEQFRLDDEIYSSVAFQSDPLSKKPHLIAGTFSSNLFFSDYDREKVIKKYNLGEKNSPTQILLDDTDIFAGAYTGLVRLYDVRSPEVQRKFSFENNSEMG